jgi:hypothetical protein
VTFIAAGARSLDRQEIGLGQRCGVPLPGDCLACRWVVEALHWFRRLRICWERREDIRQAFVTLGCAIICWRRLKTSL